MNTEQPEAPQTDSLNTTPPVPAKPDPMVTLDNGRAPLSEVLAQANPHCRSCNGKGYQDYLVGGKTESRICGCAIRKMNRKLAGDDPPALLGRVEKTKAAEDQTAKRLERMATEIAGLELEIVERLQGHDMGIEEARAALEDASQEASDAREDEGDARSELDAAQIEVTRAKSHLAECEADLVASEASVEEKLSALSALENKSAAIQASAEPLRHRIKRLRDRMALIRQKARR